MCAFLSMRQLVSLTECRVFSMLLRTYVDDSADGTQERAVVAGAYMGFYHQWNKLRKQWRIRLKQDGLKYFRATEYYSLRGEFARFRDPVKYPKPEGSRAATFLLNDLEAIIQDAAVMGVAVCIDMNVYRDVRAKEQYAAQIFPADAFEVALQSLVQRCAEIVRDEFNVQPRAVAFICDDGPSSAQIARVYTAFKAAHPALAEFMGGLVHQDDKKFLQLQAADMMAHLAKGRFIDWLDDPDKAIFTDDQALRARLKRLNVHQILVWDRRLMMDTLQQQIVQRGLPTSNATSR